MEMITTICIKAIHKQTFLIFIGYPSPGRTSFNPLHPPWNSGCGAWVGLSGIAAIWEGGAIIIGEVYETSNFALRNKYH